MFFRINYVSALRHQAVLETMTQSRDLSYSGSCLLPNRSEARNYSGNDYFQSL